MERTILFTAEEIKLISIETVEGYRFLNKTDIVPSGQMTYSDMLKKKMKIRLSGVTFGVKNVKDSGLINRKIYLTCKHPGSLVHHGKSVLTYKLIDHKKDSPLTMMWDIDCEKCMDVMSANQHTRVQRNVANEFYSGLGEKILKILENKKSQHKGLELDDLMKNTPRLMVELNTCIANHSEEQENQKTAQIHIQPIYVPEEIPKTPSRQIQSQNPLTPQHVVLTPNRPNPKNLQRIPPKSTAILNREPLTPPPSRSPSPTPIKRFSAGKRCMFSSSSSESIPDTTVTPIAASTSIENSVGKKKRKTKRKIYYTASAEAKHTLKKNK